MRAFSSLGVQFQKKGSGEYAVESPGRAGWSAPKGTTLDFGNAGTGIRLSAGILAGVSGIDCVLTGDSSLQKRPMRRILEPLQAMGADISSLSSDGKAPLRVKGTQLKDLVYDSPIASAQVKSALMLAGLSSGVSVRLSEPEPSRDHTENMLSFLGIQVVRPNSTSVVLTPPYSIQGAHFAIPGDISSAAFWMVLGLVSRGEPLLIQEVGLNPSRIGIMTVLRRMGGRIEIQKERVACGEKMGDLLVYPSSLQRISIEKELIPSIIDEIPILTIAGLFSRGGFEIKNAEELRAKESDRIQSMVSNLIKLGVSVKETKDGYSFDEVSEIKTNPIQTYMDHRIAMSFAILSKLLSTTLPLDEARWVDTSFPGFFPSLESLG